MRRYIIITTLLIALILSACQAAIPELTPTPTDIPISPISSTATSTPHPTDTPTSTATNPPASNPNPVLHNEDFAVGEVLPSSYNGQLPDGASAVLGRGEITPHISPDGEYFALASQAGMEVYDFDTIQPIWDSPQPGKFVRWLDDSRHIATTTMIYDALTGEPIEGFFTTITERDRLSPDGSLIARRGANSTLLLLNSRTGEQVYQFLPPDDLPPLPDQVSEWRLHIRFSPDGRYFSAIYYWSAGHLQTIFGKLLTVWDIQTGELINTFPEVVPLRNTVIFWSPDGKQIAALGGDLDVRVWDIEGGELIHTFEDAYTISFSPDGTMIYGWDNMSKVWDATTFEELYSWERVRHEVNWSPDSRYLLTREDGIEVRDAATGAILHTIPDIEGVVGFNAAQDKLIAMVSSHEQLDLNIPIVWQFSPTESSPLFVLHGTNHVFDIVWSPEGDQLASLTGNQHGTMLTIWDTLLSEVSHFAYIDDAEEFPYPSIDQIEWVAGDLPSIFGNFDNAARVYSIYTLDGNRLSSSDDLRRPGILSPDGRYTAGIKKLSLYPTSRDNPRVTLPSDLLDDRRVQDVAWSPDSTRIAITLVPSDLWFLKPDDAVYQVGIDYTLLILDASTGKIAAEFNDDNSIPFSLTWSPDGAELAVGYYNEDKVNVWDIESGSIARTITAGIVPLGDSAHFALDWSSDGKTIAAAYNHAIDFGFYGQDIRYSRSGSIILWDAATGERLANYDGHTEGITRLLFSPDGNRLASASWDGTVIIWDMSSLP